MRHELESAGHEAFYDAVTKTTEHVVVMRCRCGAKETYPADDDDSWTSVGAQFDLHLLEARS